jgi:hypothetical protein
MKKLILMLTVVMIGQAGFPKTDVFKDALKSNYELKNTEEALVKYLNFLIYWGRENANSSWLDEAEALIDQQEWKPVDHKSLMREYYLSRAAFLALPERLECLVKYNGVYGRAGVKDSFSVMLNVTRGQMSTFKKGDGSVTDSRLSYLTRDMEISLAYLFDLIEDGRSVYFVDAICKREIDELVQKIRSNPLSEKSAQFVIAEIEIALNEQGFDQAAEKARRLKKMKLTDADNVKLKSICHRLIRQYKEDVSAQHVADSAEWLESCIGDLQ